MKDNTVEDPEIMQYAKDKDYILFTQDKGFALNALIAGLKVWYREQATGTEYKLEARRF